MKKLFALLLAALMVISMFAGCSKEEKKSTLVYGSGDYDSINPIMNEHCEIKHLLFDSLVKLDRNGEPVASLAESWTYDDCLGACPAWSPSKKSVTRKSIIRQKCRRRLTIFCSFFVGFSTTTNSCRTLGFKVKPATAGVI